MSRLLLLMLTAATLSACGSSHTPFQRHTVIAHWNDGNAVLVVPQGVLRTAFEQEWSNGTTVDSVSLLILSEEMYVVGHGKREGESQLMALPIIRDLPNPDHMYLAPRGGDTTRTGAIGRWR